MTESGSNSPRNESKSSLVEPELFGLYKDINKDNEDNSIYDELNDNISKHTSHVDDYDTVVGHQPKPPIYIQLAKLAYHLLIIGVLGNVFIKVSEHTHDNRGILPDLTNFKLFFIFKNIIKSVAHKFHFRFESNEIFDEYSYYISNATEGIILAVLPIFIERALGFSSKNSNKSRGSNDLGLIMRASVSLVGICFGLRKLEWTSAFQASLAWSLLNPCLWLLLDGTLGGFLTSTIISLVSIILSIAVGFDDTIPKDYSFIHSHDTEAYARVLWVGSFVFLASIIFGKLGRYFFQ
ncbi:Protein involved in regulation of sterol biosynthesis [Komagataella phaffii CBS 7435]|uniref:Uncharacterized protein n=2 Tax=Komagataella phaffii TaxID=460519 RepID=C4QV83_KOMPG|nr:Hypothetical protein PAS_chr1-3_0097 [Komagataella phaffii GS115]AOA61139.1 GQ67_02352T0 [Komagataella phaffii]CAH2445809.1 Protein involved in regulation of sterol biosynthesis [Komagataella phaffii CBS 7435]AOA65553.1 GQ68_02895T0 [Komagataella phaffii GS115]CAY67156.1 Hypothetical protein PAS_chr1-3_0097 [Komagataella phaffii GS115]CCA36265.1 Protein involved in regulation of sterol biosynthesis [Komagataella phaffii CBS 7435]